VIPDISISEIALRLVVAAALSGLVGLEREWRERRTLGAHRSTHLAVAAEGASVPFSWATLSRVG